MAIPPPQPAGAAARQSTANTTSHSPRPGAGRAPARWRSADLLGGATRVEIDHAGAIYQLRLTAQGKLILTK